MSVFRGKLAQGPLSGKIIYLEASDLEGDLENVIFLHFLKIINFLNKIINFLENNLPGCLRLGGGGGSTSCVSKFMLAKIIHFAVRQLAEKRDFLAKIIHFLAK